MADNTDNIKKLSVVLVIVLSTTVALADQLIMNPLNPIDMQTSDETPAVNLETELKTAPMTSDTVEMHAEDGTVVVRAPGNSSLKPISAPASRINCSKITVQVFQALLQDPDAVEPEDYSCGLLNLISHFDKSNSRVRALEASLNTATTTIKTLESSLQTEMSKTQFLVKELNETINRENDRATKSENVIARRIMTEKLRLESMQHNLNETLESSVEKIKKIEVILKQVVKPTSSRPLPTEKEVPTEKEAPTTTTTPRPHHPEMLTSPQPQPQPQSSPSRISEQDIHKIEVKLTSLQNLIQDLSNRITRIEDVSEEHLKEGMTQISTLASEMEKETERAKEEETNLKTLISKEVVGLQDRITDEKNRVQIIEARRTADLFEEINRAKSEENRIALKLKDEMTRAATAFKRLEHHVEIQLNSTKPFEDEFKSFARDTKKRMAEVEGKLTEQISVERSRALLVENTLKSHLDTEVQRAMSLENELKVICIEEKDRARAAEHELKAAIEGEIYRAKDIEFSISSRITAEMERSKQFEYLIQEQVSRNTTLIVTEIIKEIKRAQNVELELAEKIKQETARATGAEQSLQENVNSEFSRASSHEQELFNLIQMQESSTKTVDDFKTLVETETERARNAEIKLETQIQNEIDRAKGNEDKILTILNEEVLNWKNVELNLTQASRDILLQNKELELEVRKTVMAEVARAVDAETVIKQQIIAESERAQNAEYSLSQAQGQGGNHTEISNKMLEVVRELEKDNLRLEDLSLQISRNLTGDILTLAELFDDKLDDLERNENVRLKKIEDELKKCCSGSSWRWKNPKSKTSSGSAAGTVINKIMQVFGVANEDQDGDPSAPTIKGNAKGTADSNKGRSIDDSLDHTTNENDKDGLKVIPTAEVQEVKENKSESILKEPKVNDTFGHKAANDTVVYVHSQKVVENETTGEQLPNNGKIAKKKSLRSSRRDSGSNASSINGNSLNNRNSSAVFVQRANSKVTSRFG